MMISILSRFIKESPGLHYTLKYTICAKMVECHTASVVANYLSTVEDDSTSDDEEMMNVASCPCVLKN